MLWCGLARGSLERVKKIIHSPVSCKLTAQVKREGCQILLALLTAGVCSQLLPAIKRVADVRACAVLQS